MIEVSPSCDLEQCKELVQRIAASSYLNKSARLTDMFLYLCTKVLDEGVKDIHELELGQQVFGRLAHYDTTADNIVRVHASMLRKRLREYFATDGRDEQFIVEIPRGNYAPLFRMPELRNHSFHNIELEPLHFTDAERIPQALESAKAMVEPARLRRGIPWASWAFPGLAIAFALLSTFLFIRLGQARSVANSSGVATSGAAQQFWSQIFRRGESVDIVLNDASLEFYQEANGHPVALAEYFDRSYLQSTNVGISTIKVDPGLSKELMLRRQSDFSDAAIVWKLARMADRLRSSGRCNLQETCLSGRSNHPVLSY